MFARLLAGFAGVAIPAAVVNAGLKYCQKLIQLAFMRRLTHHLHRHYCSHRAYYAASTLGGVHPMLPSNACHIATLDEHYQPSTAEKPGRRQQRY